LISADPLLDLWHIPLNPSENGGWIHLNATFLHHLRQVAVADPVLAIPAHAQKDDLNRKAAALENRHRSGSRIDRSLL
jgi:hypothetical protein